MKHQRKPELSRRRFVRCLSAAVPTSALVATFARESGADSVSAAPSIQPANLTNASFEPGDHRISVDTIFDDVAFARGARLVVDNGITVRIQGRIDAPPDVVIFAGAGRVVYETHGIVYANWWAGDDIGARWNRMWGRKAGENVPNARVIKIYGQHVLRTSINATGRRQLLGERPPIWLPTLIDLTEASLIGQTDGLPMLDLTGARYVTLVGGLLSGSLTSSPNVGLLLARNSTGAAANDIETRGVTIQGYFTIAAVYNYASELWRDFHSRFLPATGVPIMMLRDNKEGVRSEYQVIFSGGTSAGGMTLYGTRCVAYEAQNGSPEYLSNPRSCTIRIQGAHAVSLQNAYLAANERRCHVLFERGDESGNPTFASLDIWIHAGESGKPRFAVDFDPGGGRIRLPNFFYRVHNGSGDATPDPADPANASRPDINLPSGVEIANAEIYVTHGIRTLPSTTDPRRASSIRNSHLVIGENAIVNLSNLACFSGVRQEYWEC
jgi:hypothetical protein